jgi:hypothetical protein
MEKRGSLGHDPGHEAPVDVTDPEESSLWIWRMRVA